MEEARGNEAKHDNKTSFLPSSSSNPIASSYESFSDILPMSSSTRGSMSIQIPDPMILQSIHAPPSPSDPKDHNPPKKAVSFLDWGIKGLNRLVNSVMKDPSSSSKLATKKHKEDNGITLNKESSAMSDNTGAFVASQINTTSNATNATRNNNIANFNSTLRKGFDDNTSYSTAFFGRKVVNINDDGTGTDSSSCYDQGNGYKNASTRSSSSSFSPEEFPKGESSLNQANNTNIILKSTSARASKKSNRISLIGLDLQGASGLNTSDSSIIWSLGKSKDITDENEYDYSLNDDFDDSVDPTHMNKISRRVADSGSMRSLGHRRSRSATGGMRGTMDESDYLDPPLKTTASRKRSFNMGVVQSLKRMLGEDTGNQLKEYWMNDQKCKECYECKLPFTTFRRRHHCRICGQIFCGNCASSMIDGEKFGYRNQNLMRVCNYCHHLLNEYNNNRSDGSNASNFVGKAFSNQIDERSLHDFQIPRSLSSSNVPMALPENNSSGSFFGSLLTSIGSSLLPVSDDSATPSKSVQAITLTPLESRSAENASPMDSPMAQDPNKDPNNSSTEIDERFSYASAGPSILKNDKIRGLSRANSMSAGSRDRIRRKNRFRKSRVSRAGNLSRESSLVDNDESEIHSPIPVKESMISQTSSSPSPPPTSVFPQHWTPNSIRSERTSNSPTLNAAVFVPHHRRTVTGQLNFQLSASALEHIQIILSKLLHTSFQEDSENVNIESWQKIISALVMEVCNHVMPNVREGDCLDIRSYVKIKKIPSGNPKDSKTVNGLVFGKNVAHKGMPMSLQNPRILLLSFPIEYERVENQYHSIDPIITQEYDYLKIMVSRILALQPTLVIVQKSVSRVAVEMFQEENVSLLRNVKASIMEHISRCTRGEIVHSIDRLVLEPRPTLGTCEKFNSIILMNDNLCANRYKSLVYFEGCRKGSFSSVVLYGNALKTLSCLKSIVKMMVYVVYNLKLETSYLNDIQGFNIPYNSSTASTDSKGQGTLESVPEEIPCNSKASEALSSQEIVSSGLGFEEILKKYESDTLSVSPNIKFRVPFLLEYVSRLFSSSSYSKFLAWLDKADLSMEVRTGFWALIDQQTSLSPLNFQKLIILLSTHIVSDANFIACQSPEIFEIEFYRDQTDVTLGQFLEDLCFEAEVPCSEKNVGCGGKPGSEHLKSIVHDGGRVIINVYNREDLARLSFLEGISGQKFDLDDDTISIWSYCNICKESTSSIKMSEETWNYSFGKFLELYFHYPSLGCRGLRSSGGATSAASHDACKKHRIHRDHDRYFSFRHWLIRFRYEKINPYTLSVPPLEMKMSSFLRAYLKGLEYEEIRTRIMVFFEALMDRIGNFPLDAVPSEKRQICQVALNDIMTRTNMHYGDLLDSLESLRNDENTDCFAMNKVRKVFVNDYAISLEGLLADIVKRYHVGAAGVDVVANSGALMSGISPSAIVASAATKFTSRLNRITQGINGSGNSNGTSTDTNSLVVSSGNRLSLLLSVGAGAKNESVPFEEPENMPELSESPPKLMPNLAGSTDCECKSSTRPVSLDSKYPDISFFQGDHNDPYYNYNHGAAKKYDKDDEEEGIEEGIEEGDKEDDKEGDEEGDDRIKLRSQPEISKGKSISEISLIPSPLLFLSSGGIGGARLEGRAEGITGFSLEEVPRISTAVVSEVSHSATNESNVISAPNSNASNVTVTTSTTNALLERPLSLMKQITSLITGTSNQTSLIEEISPLTEHIIPGSLVVIREDEISSLIAFTLLREEYQSELSQLRKKTINNYKPVNPVILKDDEIDDLEIALLCKTANHIKMDFQSGVNAKFSCRVFFADQFDALRKRMKCDDSFPMSLSRSRVWKTNGGKSGSTFFKTKDDRFVLKQMSKAEMEAFLKFAPAYFEYVSQSLFHSLPTVLSQIYGVYRMSIKNNVTGKMTKYDMMVTENLFFGKTTISRIFDLKGSLRNRFVHKESQVLQDENLFTEFMFRNPLFLREHSKKILRASIWNDTLFLSKLDVMDYSLIVGVDEDNQELVVGIVDFIRTFTWDKKLESWVKESGILGGGGKEPTIVSPNQYKIRFREAMDRYFLLVPDPWTQIITPETNNEESNL